MLYSGIFEVSEIAPIVHLVTIGIVTPNMEQGEPLSSSSVNVCWCIGSFHLSSLWGVVELMTILEGIYVVIPFIPTSLSTPLRERGMDSGRWDDAFPTLFNSGGEAVKTPPGLFRKNVFKANSNALSFITPSFDNIAK